MNFKNIIVVFLISLLLNGSSKAQTIDSLYEVGTWQGFRSSAISFTFDDNTPNQLSVVMPMFDQYGFKMTFYPVINWGPNWTALQAAAKNGHEIGSHTVSHANLGSSTNDQQIAEYKNSQDAINQRITGQKCVTIAYPNCVTGNTALIKQYYLAGRICSGVIVPKTPSDFMNISSIVCGSQSSIQRTSDFTGKFDAAVSSNGWVVLLIHAIDTESGYSPTSSTQIKGALEYCKSNSSKFWVTSFSNAARYIKERNNISIKQNSAKDSVLIFTVTDTLDNSIYNVPVTIRRILPQGWASARILQKGTKINSQIVSENSKAYVMFDVVPDSGDIQMIKEKTTEISENHSSIITTPVLKQNYPNPFNPATQIQYEIPSAGQVHLKIFNLLGEEVSTIVNRYQQAGNYSVIFNGVGLANGMYLYQLRVNNFLATKKFMLLK